LRRLEQRLDVSGFGPHAAFIAAAYLAAAAIVLGLILWIMIDGRRLRRRIAALEAAGLHRRSAAADTRP
jgi:heme exporter protein D